jgi:predicted anti-sigma-YlaC factor YlaD
MRDEHIIRLLEEQPTRRWCHDELAAIEAHAADCEDCRRAYQAARLAESLIMARAAHDHEVSPFFKARVMAAIKERHLSPEPPAWLRLWRAAGALLLMMATVMMILIGLTIFNYPPVSPPAPQAITSQNSDSLDDVVLGADDAGDEASGYDQVLGTMYDAEGGDGD